MLCPKCGRNQQQYIEYVTNLRSITCPLCKDAKREQRRVEFEAHEAALIAQTNALSQGTLDEIRERGQKAAADLGWQEEN